jgi:penicillin-binding protein 1A
MAQAYAPFSNGGVLATAYGIERIRTPDGKLLYEHHADAKSQVIGNPPLGYMNQMLRQVIAAGTGRSARVAGYDLAGKTGTTSDYKDAWFVGYTGGFTAAVWVGKDDNTAMRKVTGGTVPAEIWRGFMGQALPRLQVRTIPSGPGAPPPTVDAIGDLLNQTTSSDVQEAGVAPTVAATPPGAKDPIGALLN